MASDLNQKWLAVLRAFPGLLSPPLEPNERLPADPFALVSAGRLTRFQYDLLAAGRGKELLLGNYVLVDQIGEGGMGVVYKARHAKLGRTVAVKVIRADRLKTKTAVRRFVREVRASAKLDHPLIVRALDADSVDGRHFLAMEFVDGVDLVTELARTGPFAIADALAVAFQVGLALQHLYENGVVHRDLKPTNLIRDRKTRAVKVLDLGLSRIIHPDAGAESAALTQAGTIIGTPDYMAPEQGQDVRIADVRSDLYALGCTLYFLLSGRVPFPGGTTIEKILRHCQETPTPITTFRPDLPPEVVAVLDRLMARHPDDRFQTPAELIAALTVLGTVAPPLSGTGSHASIPLSAATRPTPNPSQAATVVNSLATTGDGSNWRVALAEVIARDSTLSGSHPQPPLRPTVRLRDYRSAFVAGGGLVAAVVLLAVAVIPWGKWFPGPPPPPPPPDEPKALRDRVAKWLATETRDPAATAQLRADVSAAYRKAAGTPDGLTLVKILKQLPSPIDKLPDGSPSVVIGTPRPPVAHVAVSADGKFVVSGGADRVIRVWDAADLTERRAVPDQPHPLQRVAVTSDGAWVAGCLGFTTRDGGLLPVPTGRVFDAAGKPSGYAPEALSVAFAPDGKTVLFGTFEGVGLWDAKVTKQLRVLKSDGMNWTSAVAFSADGKTAFTGGNHATSGAVHDHVFVWDLAAAPPPAGKDGHPTPEKPAHRLAGHHGPVTAVVPHPVPHDPRVLTVDSQAARVFDAATGKLLHKLDIPPAHGAPRGGCWSPGGTEVVVATESGKLVWLDATTGAEHRTGAGHAGRANAVAANATHVFSAGEDGTVRKWEPKTGRDLLSGSPQVAFADDDSAVVFVPPRGAPVKAGFDRKEFPPPANPTAVTLAVTPDGAKALLRDGGKGVVWDTATGTATPCPKWADAAAAEDIALAPDGKRVLYTLPPGRDPTGVLRWTDLESGDAEKFELPPKIVGPARDVTAVAVAPDGKSVAAATHGRDVVVWDVTAGKVTSRHTPDPAEKAGVVRGLAFGPTGRRVFAVGLGTDVWVIPLGTTTRKDEFFAAGPAPRVVAVSPDDELVAVAGADGDVHVYTPAGVLKRTFKTPGPATAVAFSTDSRGLAVGLGNGTVAVYKLVQ